MAKEGKMVNKIEPLKLEYTMWNMNDVISINYQKDYIFNIEFDDGKKGNVDFSEFLSRGPVFQPFRDLSFFQNAKIEGGTISWANGADIAPESLYEKIEEDWELCKKNFGAA